MAEARRRQGRLLGTAIVVVMTAACGTSGRYHGPAGDDPGRWPADAVVRDEPRSKYGNPRSYVVLGKRYYVMSSATGYAERGIASWYGKKFHGRRTSSGEVYDMYGMTAAHKALPLPTYVEVTNLENGRRTVLRVNDRGPFHANRIIDLSYSAAKKLGIVAKGTGYVEVRAVSASAPARATVQARASRPPARTSAVRPTPAVVPRAGNPVTLYLQAGAFAVRANAERLRIRLQPVAGDLVRIVPARAAGRSVYRVRLGPLDNVAHADRLSGSLVAMGLETPGVVVE